MAGKYHILKNANGAYRFNLRAANGETILASESYTAKASAVNGVESVKANSGDEGRYEMKETKDKEPYFVLMARNGEIVGRSENYSSEAAAKTGMASVMANGPSAETVDETGE